MEAKQILAEMKDFFSQEFPDFSFYDPSQKQYLNRKTFAFYKQYQTKGLVIIIYTSIIYDQGQIKIANNKMVTLIRVSSKHNTQKRTALRLKDFYRKNWKKAIRQRIRVLKYLIDDIRPCCRCNYHYPIPRQSFNRQGTKYVGYYCPKCAKRNNSTYGICLKTELHKLLK